MSLFLRKANRLVVGLCFFSFALLVNAQAQYSEITKRVARAFDGSGLVVKQILPVEYFDDLYEVTVLHNNEIKILYSNGSGSHLILGDLLESESLKNLTEQRLSQATAIDFEKDLRPEFALKKVYGNGKRKIAIFEDPNCGYCKSFRRNAVSKLEDTTVYTYVVPVLSQDSVVKARQILCSANPQVMLDQWMLNNNPPTGPGDCGAPVDGLKALAKALRVTGTPTVIFEDGTRASGAVTATDLNRMIAKAAR